jgi:hypothetical protein
MHQNSASGVQFGAASDVSSAVDTLRYADQLRPLSLIGKLRSIVEHENKTIRRSQAITSRLEMTGQNVRLANPVIGEKAIGRLGIGPILANERNALTHGAPDPLKQCAKPLAKPRILKFASGNLFIYPGLDLGRRTAAIAPHGTIS